MTEKTKEYANFYENLKEAQMRLRGTVVLYDGVPHYVMAITNHRADGIFSVYMEPIGPDMIIKKAGRPPYDQYNNEDTQLGPVMDEWMAVHPKSAIVRKHMNSPKFNRFRPFPLGMCNYSGAVLFLERQPTRKTEQGLTSAGIVETSVSVKNTDGSGSMRTGIPVTDPSMRATIEGNYPSAVDCISNLCDKTVTNSAVAFHRNFAIVRGPVGTLFLAYKTGIVGFLNNSDASVITLPKESVHLKEAIAELQVFGNIIVK